MTDQQKLNWDMQAYGCSEDDAMEGIRMLVAFNFGDEVMSIGSILSDAQELMAMGRHDTARQYLNRIKCWMFTRQAIKNQKFVAAVTACGAYEWDDAGYPPMSHDHHKVARRYAGLVLDIPGAA